MKRMQKQNGQVILILVLVMTVALAIGLSIVQKSLVDVSTSTKVEQSSRAFSAAEAGVEQALTGGSTSVTFPDPEAKSQATVADAGLLPPPASFGRQVALELPLMAKEEVKQIWLADYTSSSNPPPSAYAQNTLDVYWGNSTTDKAAIELTLIYYGPNPADPDPAERGAKFRNYTWYFDQISRGNGFSVVACSNNNYIGLNNYTCKQTISFANPPINVSGLMLIRVRLLYTATSQPVAFQAVGNCPSSSCAAYSLPAQDREIISTGISGETQRKVKVHQSLKVVPPYFNYAIFSAGDITK